MNNIEADEHESGYELAQLLEPGGEIASKLENYEYREGQIALMESVDKAFKNDLVLIAEAGTGVGKSMAYLIPTILWAAEHRERVVISTATIALGQQIVCKDIPTVLKALGKEIKITLVNGRGNYLCRKRLREAQDNLGLFATSEDAKKLQALAGWSERSESGNRADLDFPLNDAVWAEVRAEHDSCAWSFCPLYERCFLRKARLKANESGILVTNHHLLFADLAARMEAAEPEDSAVLPPYQGLIIDEAQHIENTATSLFSAALSIAALKRLLNRIHRPQSSGSLLMKMLNYTDGKKDHAETAKETERLTDLIRKAAKILDNNAQELLGSELSLRLSGIPTENEKRLLRNSLEDLKNAMDVLGVFLSARLAEMIQEVGNRDLEAVKKEVEQGVNALKDMAGVADNFLTRQDFPDYIFWLEKNFHADGSSSVQYNRTPLFVADIMNELLWGALPTIVSLSATLTFNGDFSHWKQQVGINEPKERCIEQIVPSPFDYQNNAFLGVAGNAPDPVNTEAWESFLVDAVSQCIRVSGGHALVLFTSYATLQRTISGVRNVLGQESPLLLEQERGDKGRQLAEFRNESSSVLFASSTFWEGVDIAGDSLRLVIITRLPFRQPGHPIYQARSKAMEQNGLSPFYGMTLPEAVKRFRQGFGRLIRHSNDRGAVIVLDPRVRSKKYGKVFLESLPNSRRCIKAFDTLILEMENFFYTS